VGGARDERANQHHPEGNLTAGASGLAAGPRSGDDAVLRLTDSDVARVLTPADAIAAAADALARLAEGRLRVAPRSRLGSLATHSASDDERGLSCVSATEGAGAAVVLFESGQALAAIEARELSAAAAAAGVAVAARHLARADATTLGVIGCGRHARAQVASLRAALPGLRELVAHCRDASRLAAFCAEVGAEAAAGHREAAAADVVLTATTATDPVLRGEWLPPGALVCATGATRREARELDNAVVERASFVCCDSLVTARLDAGDLVEPVEQGRLDWLEVHELQDVAGGALAGRQAEDDVVLYKAAGSAALELALAALVAERVRAGA